MVTSKGVLVFARNNAQIDYCKQAYALAKRARKFLDVPTSIVTDSTEFLLNEYPDAEQVFDKIISIVWKEEDLAENTTLSKTENHALRTFYDGTLIEKKLHFKNETRTLAYELSPYDETLVLDTDVVICNSTLKKCFDRTHDFLIYRTSYDLANNDRSTDFERISDTSVDFYWATCVFFRKTQLNEIFFNLIKHVQEFYTHYRKVYNIVTTTYRNDFAFSIAIHIINGFKKGDFAKRMPGKLFFTADRDILHSIDGDKFTFLLQCAGSLDKYSPCKFQGNSVHVMNKYTLEDNLNA